MEPRLPVLDLEPEITARLRKARRLVLSAPTGSGKSTQVPPMLLRGGFLERGQAVILQPRRLAARLLAARVAHELGSPLGGLAGYQVRFENVTGPSTRLRFVTEGILLREMIRSPNLEGVAALVFDEFHERHLYGDLTLARALELQERERPDLAILVLSATLDVERVSEYLRPCETLRAEGRLYPVAIEYAPGEGPVWERAADAFARWARAGGRGDVLVFMPGAYEIGRTLEAFRERPEAQGYLLLPLHGELPPAEQDAAVARYDRPKVVAATNVAETSITIEGVRLVIDSGLARVARHDPARGINTLFVEKISRASADQRAGRAGRTAPGTCVRLWGERDHVVRPARDVPEVRRMDLSEALLLLEASGVEDPRAFRWMDPPDERALAGAEELLHDLGALREGRLTDVGRRMAAFPVHPRFARMLLAAEAWGIVPEAALAAALAEGREILVRNPDDEAADFRERVLGGRAESDFEVLRRAWEYAARHGFRAEACRRAGIHAGAARRVGPAREQFLRIAEREGLDVRPRGAPEGALARCLLAGFPDRVARRAEPGTLRCELVHGRRALLARESAVRSAPLLVAAEIREVEGRGGEVQTLLSLAAAIEPEWLREAFPEDMNVRRQIFYDPAARRVVAEDQTRFRDLVLERRQVEPPPAEEAARLLAAEVRAGRLEAPGWDEAVERWIRRVNFLARACPELGIPPIDEAARDLLVLELCAGAVSYKDLKERPALPVVRGWLSPAQQELVERHAPERLELPNGRRPRVEYGAGEPPTVALTIQELYGVTRLPAVALGRVAPRVEILAPSRRPVQVTTDLAAFWAEQYPKVKKELQRRYPKHEWR
jgi:ATP-dependent helicase HrpB